MNKDTGCSNKNKLIIYALAFILLNCLCNIVKAKNTDSLKALLYTHKAEDTTKVNVLSAIAVIYKDANLDSMISYARKGLELADKINFDKGKANCMRSLGLAYLHRNEYEQAVNYYKGALSIFEKINDRNQQALILRSIGDIYYRQTNYTLATDYYSKSEAIAEASNNMQEEGMALIGIGGVYTDQSNYSEAINYYLKGLEDFEKIKDNKGISLTLINIATIYSEMGNYKMAAGYIDKAIPINEGITEKEVAFANIVNIGAVYGNMGDYKNALAAFQKGVILADSIGDSTWENICLGNIADAYEHMGAYDTALAKYIIVLKQAEKLNDTNILVMAQSSIGRLLIKKGQTREAISNLLPGMTTAESKQMKGYIFDIAGSLSDAYEQLHDYPKALAYHKIYFAYRDSLDNDKNDKHIQQMQFDYELQKKETQIVLLNKDKIITHDRNEEQKVIESALAVGLLLLVVISLLLYRNTIIEKRNKALLLKQKNEIQLQAAKLEELVKFKDKIFSVLSHDLRGPIGALTATMTMLNTSVITPEEFLEINPEINKQLTSINTLLDNLLNWARSAIQGQAIANPEIIDMQHTVDQNISLLRESIERKGINININIPENTEAFCDPAQIGIVLRNLISNAIKFTKQGGNITISAKNEANKIQLFIADSGVGMTPEQLTKLFTTAPGNNTYGTNGEKGTGLGLLLCYEFIKGNNGTISATSEINKGSKFTIELPTPPLNP